MKNRILIVEDEVEILYTNMQMLKRRGYDVYTAETVSEANDIINSKPIDLLILDIMLPDGSGFDICNDFREKNMQPILFLSAKSDTMSKVDALRKGGDYFLAKPYNFDELLAIIERLLERQNEFSGKNSISVGNLHFDHLNFSAKVAGRDIFLTKIEATILSILIKNINKEISRDYLFKQVWGNSDRGDSRVLRTHISRLKQKIDCENTDSYDIISVYGKGYIFTKG